MYEKLDKIRAELARARKRRKEAEVREQRLEEKLREAEGEQILADVAAFKLTPERLAELLQMACGGNRPVNGITSSVVTEEKTEDEREESEDEE